jgi:hypothetical protein
MMGNFADAQNEKTLVEAVLPAGAARGYIESELWRVALELIQRLDSIITLLTAIEANTRKAL